MRRSIFRAAAFALGLTLAAVTAAAEETEPAKAAAAAPSAYSSPEECYAAFVGSKRRFDYATMVSCLSERDRKIDLGWAAFHVERQLFFRTPLMDEAIAFRKRYGMETYDVMGAMQMHDPIGHKGPDKVLELVGSKVSDPVRFLKDANVILMAEAECPLKENETLKLVDVAIEGDTATGALDDLLSKLPIRFARENGSWVIVGGGIFH